ncbi:3974_t:CDS:2, partial [Ambispora gerdemannii]
SLDEDARDERLIKCNHLLTLEYSDMAYNIIIMKMLPQFLWCNALSYKFCLKYSTMRWRAMVFNGLSFLLLFISAILSLHWTGSLRAACERRGVACYGRGGGN